MGWTRKTGLEKIGKYCAYQERSHVEVRRKLGQLGCPWDEVDDIMVTLIEQGFLNEERFARSYTRGKFNQKRWGRIKIRQGLREKRVGEHLIELALQEEIDPNTYRANLLKAIEKHWTSEETPQFEARQKLKNQLLRKGYEWELVEEVLRDRFPA